MVGLVGLLVALELNVFLSQVWFAGQSGWSVLSCLSRGYHILLARSLLCLVDEKGAGCSWENLLMSLDIIINDLFTVKLNSSHFSRNIDFYYFFSLISFGLFSRRFLHAVLRSSLANALSSALLGP